MHLFADIYLSTFMPLLFVAMAAFFMVVSLKTLLGRHPIIFSARWLFGLVCLGFLPSVVQPFMFNHVGGSLGLFMWLVPVLPVVVLFFMWLQMRGYMAFGISDTYFREALLSSAASLEYTIEETISRLKIKETGQEMQVAIQAWMGTAQIKPANRASADVVGRLAAGMRQYFATTPGKMNYITSYFYLIVGLLTLGCAIGLLMLPKFGVK